MSRGPVGSAALTGGIGLDSFRMLAPGNPDAEAMKLEPVYLLAPAPAAPKGFSRRALLLVGVTSAAAGMAVGWTALRRPDETRHERLDWALNLIEAPLDRVLAEADAFFLVAAVTKDSRLEPTLIRMFEFADGQASPGNQDLLESLRTVAPDFPRLAHALETRDR